MDASSDADWGITFLDLKSGGYIMCHGISVQLLSKNQTSAAMSTADAEYRPIAEVIEISIHIQQLTKHSKENKLESRLKKTTCLRFK